MDTAGAFWDGSGSALLGAALSGFLAVGTFYATRWHERKAAREQLAYQAAEDIARALLELEGVLDPPPWGGERGDWKALWKAADDFGDVCIVRNAALSEYSLLRAVAEIYNMVYDALRIMRRQASDDPSPVAGVDVDTIIRETTAYLEEVVNVLIEWRRTSVARTPHVPDLPWRQLLEPEPPRMIYPIARPRWRLSSQSSNE
ncbi:hypothetical protein [Streptomyces sp. NPDC046909]|uniref:hypothetical protein n=1 Tax=Streptomyces sp. NPDC046909 TaxID=3155617 RepID=UPI0033DE6AE6